MRGHGSSPGRSPSLTSQIIVQTGWGQLAYQIEHAGAKPDDEATFVAGVESALKAYESILSTEPKSRVPFLDDLVVKRDKGELAAFVHDNISGCQNKPAGNR